MSERQNNSIQENTNASIGETRQSMQERMEDASTRAAEIAALERETLEITQDMQEFNAMTARVNEQIQNDPNMAETILRTDQENTNASIGETRQSMQERMEDASTRAAEIAALERETLEITQNMQELSAMTARVDDQIRHDHEVTISVDDRINDGYGNIANNRHSNDSHGCRI